MHAFLQELARRREALRAELEAIFPAGQPVRFTWELGCGHGHFLVAYARAHPEKLCIGIDIAGERIERALRKRERERLPNLHFLRAEGRLFLQALPERARFAELFLLFPDPWPKLRHHKHRIIQPEFLSRAAPHATDDSRLYFRTDSTSYVLHARRVIQSHPDWKLSAEEWPFEFITVFQNRAPSYESLIARRTPSNCPPVHKQDS